jgi:hypothetical protein
MGGRSRDTSRVRGRRGRERLVAVVGAACASAGSAQGVGRGAGNGIQAEGAVALAAALQGNTTLQRLGLGGMWTARTRVCAGMGGRSGGPALGTYGERWRRGRERLVGAFGAACASAGSEHGVVRGADNLIQAEGAVALAVALQGNTTLQRLGLGSMWTARTRVFCGNGRPLPGDLANARAERRERLVVVVGAACASVGS